MQNKIEQNKQFITKQFLEYTFVCIKSNIYLMFLSFNILWVSFILLFASSISCQHDFRFLRSATQAQSFFNVWKEASIHVASGNKPHLIDKAVSKALPCNNCLQIVIFNFVFLLLHTCASSARHQLGEKVVKGRKNRLLCTFKWRDST